MISEIELIIVYEIESGFCGRFIGGMIAGKHIFSDALFLVCMGLKPIFLFYFIQFILNFRVHTNVLVKISVTFSHQLGVYIAGGECTYA